MIKKFYCVFLACVVLSACSADGGDVKVNSVIKIPNYDMSAAESTTGVSEVQRRDLIGGTSVGGGLGYFYADVIRAPATAALITYDLTQYQKLAAGDVIAVFDSSELDYTITNQQIVTDAAYREYSANDERQRILYEIEQTRLEQLQTEKDKYTVKAPYDCVVAAKPEQALKLGDTIKKGEMICQIARENDVFSLYVPGWQSEETTPPVGAAVSVTLSGKDYSCTVAASPDYLPRTAERDNYLNMGSVIRFDDGELERLLTDVPGAVAAGWVTITLPVSENHHDLSVPANAVKGGEGNHYCFVIENDSRIRVPVTTGDTIDGFTIIKNGLHAGQLVAN